MNRQALRLAGFILTGIAVVSPVFADPPAKRSRFIEAYPERVQARLEQRQRAFKALQPSGHFAPNYVFRRLNLWLPGQTLRVAFQGGDVDLRKKVAAAASEWSKFGNIKFDFGPQDGAFNEWTDHDKEYSAEIRISFDQEGYWSVVGNGSINRKIVGPAEASMNFGGFTIETPSDFQAIVMHEFGHALGLEHEHQSPVGGCDSDFRWNDDPGYVPTTDSYGQYIEDSKGRQPGLYTVLGGPPNNWSKAKVDFNLRQLQEDSSAFILSEFDKDSIMKYYFDAWMFRDGVNSHCYSKENLVLSDKDKSGVAKVYPKAPQDVIGFLNDQQVIFEKAASTTSLPESTAAHLASQLNQIKSLKAAPQ